MKFLNAVLFVMAAIIPLKSYGASTCDLNVERASAAKMGTFLAQDLKMVQQAIAKLEAHQKQIQTENSVLAKEVDPLYHFEIVGLIQVQSDLERHIADLKGIGQSDQEIQKICESHKK